MKVLALSLSIAVCLLFPTLTHPVLADSEQFQRPTVGIPDSTGVLWDTPVYDPVSKRYFELKWGHYDLANIYAVSAAGRADTNARAQVFKGVHGRLAIVSSPEIHEFLLRTFHPHENALIGIRYLCKTHRLQLSDGALLSRDAFQPWHKVWKQDNICVGYDTYAPVTYTSVEGGFRWILKGENKGFGAYFVEFPTGHE